MVSGSRFLDFVPVHGGITYGDRREDGSYIYGFDTNHAHDSTNPDIRNTDWLKEQTARMGFGIQAAARYEQAYMACKTAEERRTVVNNYFEYMQEEYGGDAVVGIGAILTMLTDLQDDEVENP